MNHWLKRLRRSIRQALPLPSYFKRLIWLGCISVSLPIIVLGTVYYHFSMDKLKTQFQEDSRVSLTQLKDRMENRMSKIEYQSMQLAVNSLIRNALGMPGFSDQYVRQLDILDLMTVQKNASDLIQDIVFYGSESDTVLSNFYGKTSLNDSPQKADIRAAMAMEKSEGWTYLPNFSGDGYISYVRQLPVMRVGPPQGVLIYRIKAGSLDDWTRSGTFGEPEKLIVIDADNRILLHSWDASLLGRTAADVPFYREILSHSGDDRPFAVKSGSGEKMLAVVNRATLGRTYISLLSERELAGPLNWMRLLVIGSVLAILLFGFVLSFASSRLAYSPIDRLIRYGGQLRLARSAKMRGSGNEIDFIRSSLDYLNEQAETLRAYVENIQPGLREQLLLKLLDANGAVNERKLEAEKRSLRLSTDGGFAVLIVRPENLFKEKRFLPSEGPIIAFAVQNVMRELLERISLSGSFVVGRDEKEAVAIVRFAESEDDRAVTDALQAYADNVVQALQAHLSFTVAVGIGGVRSGLARISESYREAALALQMHLFDDNRKVFRYREPAISSEKLTVFNYPKELELQITEYLQQGELHLAAQALQQFYARIRLSESYNAVMQSFHILLSSIIQSLEEMGYGVLDSLGDNLFEQLKERQTYREMQEWFVEFLFPLHRQLTEENRSNAARKAVQRVVAHLEANYGMPSLIECAELVGMSPSYLSRMFKQEAGMTFIEYLMKYKVERAKKLLAETDYTVTEVAELIGYTERNLNRAFQRHLMMSPKQYRMSVR